ncbi:hypothetical protein V9K67_24580 [Paraflavisolibacter sp. H34]|uniref:hypothetical protein n=1 Tax=Huijunlia imazamoxiresistens TaxID=3127457 RepID=UPI00301A520D
MTLYEFNGMTDPEKAQVIAGAARIGDREDGQHIILLYQIDAFYVEVYRDKEHLEIRRFRSFTSLDPLEPYLGEINLPDGF